MFAMSSNTPQIANIKFKKEWGFKALGIEGKAIIHSKKFEGETLELKGAFYD